MPSLKSKKGILLFKFWKYILLKQITKALSSWHLNLFTVSPHIFLFHITPYLVVPYHNQRNYLGLDLIVIFEDVYRICKNIRLLCCILFWKQFLNPVWFRQVFRQSVPQYFFFRLSEYINIFNLLFEEGWIHSVLHLYLSQAF